MSFLPHLILYKNEPVVLVGESANFRKSKAYAASHLGLVIV